MNRAVAVFLRYLNDLTPEHQQMWNTKILGEDFKLHPDYYRSSLGHWQEGISIFKAFIEELHQTNEISRLMNRQPLFRNDYHESKRPKEFGFLIRPTLKEFNSFIHLLDKMISDNIDLGFFQNEVPYEDEEVRGDGKVIVKSKGTLRILKEWLSEFYSASNSQPVEEMFSVFRKIRRMRQKPAHSVEEDNFDQEYLRKQRQIMKEAFSSIRTLRLILASHPNVSNYEIPQWFRDSKIWLQ